MAVTNPGLDLPLPLIRVMRVSLRCIFLPPPDMM
jgi:hypothetical protein